MDNSNLTQEQLLALEDAMNLIDDALAALNAGTDQRKVIDLLHDARNKVNSVRAGERNELGSRL